MKTYTFHSKNTDTVIILSAKNEKEAFTEMCNLIVPSKNDFRLDSEEGETVGECNYQSKYFGADFRIRAKKGIKIPKEPHSKK